MADTKQHNENLVDTLADGDEIYVEQDVAGTWTPFRSTLTKLKTWILGFVTSSTPVSYTRAAFNALTQADLVLGQRIKITNPTPAGLSLNSFESEIILDPNTGNKILCTYGIGILDMTASGFGYPVCHTHYNVSNDTSSYNEYPAHNQKSGSDGYSAMSDKWGNPDYGNIDLTKGYFEAVVMITQAGTGNPAVDIVGKHEHGGNAANAITSVRDGAGQYRILIANVSPWDGNKTFLQFSPPAGFSIADTVMYQYEIAGGNRIDIKTYSGFSLTVADDLLAKTMIVIRTYL